MSFSSKSYDFEYFGEQYLAAKNTETIFEDSGTIHIKGDFTGPKDKLIELLKSDLGKQDVVLIDATDSP